jgi:hypothetical protein
MEKKEKFDADAYIAKIEKEAKTEENKKSDFYNWGINFIYITAIYIAVSFLYYLLTGLLFQVNIKSTAEGIFVGAGFCASFAGIMFVLDNLTLQRKSLIKQSLEIAYTRVEVKQSIEELEEANSYYEEQNKLMKFQQNENTFFTLIDLHRKLYNELNIDDKPAGQVQKEKLMERLQNDVNNKGNHIIQNFIFLNTQKQKIKI